MEIEEESLVRIELNVSAQRRAYVFVAVYYIDELGMILDVQTPWKRTDYLDDKS